MSNSNSTNIIPPNPPLVKGGGRDFSGANSKTISDASSMRGDTTSLQKIVILGIGNLLLSDEGVGVHVANELMKMELPPEVSVVEGGTDGFRLIDVITEADYLIVIDSVRGEAAPGSIYRFDIDEVRNCPPGFKTSVHQIGILDVIDMSGLIGKKPHTTIIGIEPKSLEMGMELSPEVKAKIPRIIELIWDELKQFQNKRIG